MRINKYVNLLNLKNGDLLLYNQLTKQHIILK